MKNLFTFIILMLLWTGNSRAQTVILSPTGDPGFETGIIVASDNWIQKNNISNGGVDIWAVGAVPVVSKHRNLLRAGLN